LGVSGHDAVLDAVVHHLDEVSATVRSSVQIALFALPAHLLASRCSRDVNDARRNGLEDGVEVLHGGVRAADHHAVPALQTPHAAAGTDVHVVYALGCERLCPADIVDVVGIAPVDEDVTGFKIGDDSGDGFVNHGRRDHQPNGARLAKLAREIFQRRGTYSLFLHQLFHRLGEHIENHAFVARFHEPPHHVGAHSSQTYHSQLHCSLPFVSEYLLMLYMFCRWRRIKLFVELSCASAGSVLLSSSPMIFLARTLPSSTPHWSNESMLQIVPWVNTECSYSATSLPSVSGVSSSAMMMFDGRLPSNTRCGTSQSGVPSAFTSSAVLPNASASVCAKTFAISKSW